jgi:hypothetical protein
MDAFANATLMGSFEDKTSDSSLLFRFGILTVIQITCNSSDLSLELELELELSGSFFGFLRGLRKKKVKKTQTKKSSKQTVVCWRCLLLLCLHHRSLQ